jgi:hypothetical protein
VRTWALKQGFEYRFLDDDLFDYLPSRELLLRYNVVIASDLARLRWLRHLLLDYDRVIWCDADFLIIDVDGFKPLRSRYAVGREVWVDQTTDGQLKAFKKVHNAYLQFDRGNAFLEFYIETAEHLLERNTGGVPNQFIGPKLLTALHNVAGLTVHEQAGMVSPILAAAFLRRAGALDLAEYSALCQHSVDSVMALFAKRSDQLPLATNLSASCIESQGLNSDRVEQLCELLLSGGMII